uniref:Uncharacterized protein n=1 Tax=Trypanosoma vivax (strain Y486) TaxID=1055687 RepID=G0U3T6_TRYVY|nr:hypothetical protein TVY486_0907660 [Trypanosoma vivax Y486]
MGEIKRKKASIYPSICMYVCVYLCINLAWLLLQRFCSGWPSISCTFMILLLLVILFSVTAILKSVDRTLKPALRIANFVPVSDAVVIALLASFFSLLFF